MSLYATRHGQTPWNKEKKVQGKTDIPLNETGLEQAEETGKKLKDVDIDIIFCSPLMRARQTAEKINANRNIEIIFDERISERNFGEFEGLKPEEFPQDDFWSYKKNLQYKQAENIQDFLKRIYGFLEYIKKEYKGKNVLIVAHGGISIAANCYFKGIPENDKLLEVGLKNCEVVNYDFEIEKDLKD